MQRISRPTRRVLKKSGGILEAGDCREADRSGPRGAQLAWERPVGARSRSKRSPGWGGNGPAGARARPRRIGRSRSSRPGSEDAGGSHRTARRATRAPSRPRPAALGDARYPGSNCLKENRLWGRSTSGHAGWSSPASRRAPAATATRTRPRTASEPLASPAREAPCRSPSHTLLRRFRDAVGPSNRAAKRRDEARTPTDGPASASADARRSIGSSA